VQETLDPEDGVSNTKSHHVASPAATIATTVRGKDKGSTVVEDDDDSDAVEVSENEEIDADNASAQSPSLSISQHPTEDNANVQCARCALSDRNSHSRMTLIPTPARLKRTCCDD
jgi:hypothetical protein